ncbi:MAG: BrnT family toxin [Acidobacteria bacterium]|nr:BrnT family toxin [Acidobacteriota bacterium]
MKTYAWNPDKNELLRKERGISFEDVVFHIEAGDALDIFAHPNQSKYPRQQIIVVCVEDYVYLVPFVENDFEIFLKTIIPSNKATKQYLGDENE